MTIQDVITFVHEQRAKRGADKVLARWTDGQIASAVSTAIDYNSFGWVLTGGKLSGFAWGIPRVHERVFDVQSVVCNSSRDLAHLMLMVSQNYKGWTLRGLRRKKVESRQIVDYKSVDRFVHLTQLNASVTL